MLRRRPAGVAELVDAAGLGPAGPRGPWRFESSRPHLEALAAARAAEEVGAAVVLEAPRRPPVDRHPAHGVDRARTERKADEGPEGGEAEQVQHELVVE